MTTGQGRHHPVAVHGIAWFAAMGRCPQSLCAAAEKAERLCNSTVCRDFAIALPHQLTNSQRWDLVIDIAQRLVKRFGFALQASHHRPVKEDPRYMVALTA